MTAGNQTGVLNLTASSLSESVFLCARATEQTRMFGVDTKSETTVVHTILFIKSWKLGGRGDDEQIYSWIETELFFYTSINIWRQFQLN